MQYIVLPNALGFCGDMTGAFSPQVSYFADGEISMDLSGIEYTNAHSFTVVQSLFGNSEAILQILFTVNTILRSSSKDVHLLLTYMSYARQDREITKDAPFSAKVIADILSLQQVRTISVIDLHSQQIQGFFSKPCFNISLKSLIAEYIHANFTSGNYVILSPDIGGAKLARQIATILDADSAVVEKIRHAPGISNAVSIIGNVTGKTCIIVDDIIDSAGTLCNAADILKQSGASAVFAFAIHGIFSGEAQSRIAKSALEKVYISNTIARNIETEKIQYFDASKYVISQFEERTHGF